MISFIDTDGMAINWVKVKIGQTGFQYQVEKCTTGWTSVATYPAACQGKVAQGSFYWSLQKSESSGLSMKCNEDEAFTLTFADSTETECVSYWGRDTTSFVFVRDGDEADTASRGYRFEKGKLPS